MPETKSKITTDPAVAKTVAQAADAILGPTALSNFATPQQKHQLQLQQQRREQQQQRNTSPVVSTTSITTSSAMVTSDSALPGIDFRDDLREATQWMRKGRVDSRGLSKYMPHTSAGLVDGTIDPAEFADSLGAVYDNTAIAKHSSAHAPQLNPVEYVAHRLVVAAIPAKWFRSSAKVTAGSVAAEDAKARRQYLMEGLAYDFQERLMQVMTEENPALSKMPIWTERVFRTVCVEWAERIDKDAFNGKRGRFLRFCPLLDPKEFAPIIHEVLKNINYTKMAESFRKAGHMKKELLRAAQGVARGLHEVKDACWECGRSSSNGTTITNTDGTTTAGCRGAGVNSKCSQCEVATYCSRACQSMAWKEGHKLKCQTLKNKYEAFSASNSAVDAAHAAGSVLDGGFRLCDEYDFLFLQEMYTFPQAFPEKLPGPSMQYFYENLGRVSRGEWWVFPECDSLEDFMIEFEGNEVRYHRALSMLLSYDYFGFAADKSHYGRKADAAAVTACLCRSQFVQIILKEFGVPMPASKYLAFYKSAQPSNNITDRARLRRQCKAGFVERLRDEFHK